MKKTALLLSILLMNAVMLSYPVLSYGISTRSTVSADSKITGIAVNPETGMALAISGESKKLYIIDASKGEITRTITLSAIPAGAGVDTARNTGLVFSSDGTLITVDLQSGNIIDTITTKKHLNAISIDKKSDTAILGTDNGLIIIDLGPCTVNREIPLNFRAEKIVTHNDLAFVAGSGSEKARNSYGLQNVELSTGLVLKQTSLPEKVAGMAIDVTLNTLVLTLSNRNAIYFYNTDLQLTTELPSCKSSANTCLPAEITVNPSTNYALVTNAANNSIFVVDIAGKTLIESASTYPELSSIAIDSSWNLAYIAYKDGIALERLKNKAPILDFLVPQTAKSGSPGYNLSIEGARFLRDSQAQFNSKNLATNYANNEKLHVEIDAKSLTKPGEFPVTVTNPLPGGGVSNSLTFKVYNLTPTIESILPDTIAVDSIVKFRVSGSNFFNGSTIVINGVSLKTRFISSI